MNKFIAGLLLVCLILSGCTTVQSLSTGTKTGAAVGAITGGILGVVIDSSNPWRGAIIGATVGAAAGGWIGQKIEGRESVAKSKEDVAARAAKDAAEMNSAVKYSRVTEQGIIEDIIATPSNLKGKMRTVTVEYYRDNTLIATETHYVEV
ncbi:MAG: glycine zipper 2TM domain-containing protein [Elusimicrobia bacterium]|nr:glycine zipper 2TM domain-containing protein [Elusimicrobiota bacterium]